MPGTLLRKPLENWTIGFDYEGDIAGIWNGKMEESEKGQYIIKNAGWNQDIPIGQSVEFGISGRGDFMGFPKKYRMLGQADCMSSEAYGVDYKVESDWGSGFKATITITNLSQEDIEDWVLEMDYGREIQQIWNATVESHEGNHYVIKNAGYNANILPGGSISFGFLGGAGSPEDIISNQKVYSYGYGKLPKVDTRDTDGDGVPDILEDMIQTDKERLDSDGDGLPDGYEIFKSLTYPTEADTDGNGVPDGEEDPDEDGISTAGEYAMEMDPMSGDTDRDGLYDHAELLFGMKPNKQSTLEDGIYDGNRIFDSEIPLEEADNGVRAYLQMRLTGQQANALTTGKVTDDSFLDSEIPGYICQGYELGMDAAFDSALLTFELPESILNRVKNPAIFYWNEEMQLFEEVAEQYVEGNKVRARLTHFSKYICLDKDQYNRAAFQYRIEAPTEEEFVKKNFHIAFVLDDSGSVSYTDFDRMRKECVALTEQLSDTDRMSLFMFGDSVYRLISFTDQKSFANAMNAYRRKNESTALYSGIYTGTEEFASYSEDGARMMIVVTDGYDNHSKVTIHQAIEKAISEKIMVYCVGVEGANSSVLKRISESTGGSYYHINQFSQLSHIFDAIVTEADLYKDRDGDGISDYHEKKIALGELQLGSGKGLKASARLDYSNADSDDDGLLDGEEVAIKKLAGGNYYLYLYSNPCLADTDGDGIDDYGESYMGISPLFPEIKSPRAAQTKLGSMSGYKLPGNFDSSAWAGTTPWEEWKALIYNDGKAWNYLHNVVQNDIKNRYPSYQLSLEEPIYRPDGKKRKYSIDIFRKESLGIWEVKPSSYAQPPKLELAQAQLANYVAEKPGLYGGAEGTILNGSMITYGDYSIVYSNSMNGLIFYQFKRNTPIPAYAPQLERQREEEKRPAIIANYVYQPNDFVGTAIKVAAVVGAVSIIGGTLTEDVLTGGVGMGDDIPSIMLALELLRRAGYAVAQ